MPFKFYPIGVLIAEGHDYQRRARSAEGIAKKELEELAKQKFQQAYAELIEPIVAEHGNKAAAFRNLNNVEYRTGCRWVVDLRAVGFDVDMAVRKRLVELHEAEQAKKQAPPERPTRARAMKRSTPKAKQARTKKRGAVPTAA